MKRTFAVLLTLVLSLSLLTGCKSAEVKAVEEAIKAIGTVTIDSVDSVTAAEDLYNALSADDQGKVSNAETLTEAGKALADIMTKAFLDDLNQLVPALNERNIVRCYELIDSMEAALDKMPPSVREQVLDATKDADGKNIQENFDNYRSTLESLCVHNTKIAAPVFVVESDGGNLVNDHGDFAAYNAAFLLGSTESRCRSAFAAYKEYISQYGTISDETDSSFKVTDPDGNVLEVLMSIHSRAATLQVRVPRF